MTIYLHSCLKCGGAVELVRELDSQPILKCVNCAFTIDSELARRILLKLEKKTAA